MTANPLPLKAICFLRAFLRYLDFGDLALHLPEEGGRFLHRDFDLGGDFACGLRSIRPNLCDFCLDRFVFDGLLRRLVLTACVASVHLFDLCLGEFGGDLVIQCDNYVKKFSLCHLVTFLSLKGVNPFSLSYALF